MAKLKTVFVCQECGYTTPKWLGRCPDCSKWNCFIEETLENNKRAPSSVSLAEFTKPLKITEIKSLKNERYKTNLIEFDRVLSGGIVKGSLVLIAGDPGIGKSTLLLQICQSIGENGYGILYISGEESASQIKMRADRLNVNTEKLYILAETNMDIIEGIILKTKPDILIIDSIQTVYKSDLSSAPGSVTQIRESASTLMKIAKTNEISVFIVGHATKDGTFAGPRVLEHIVDTALYFEGERHLSYRILRAVKNRFGGTNEIGVFEMGRSGLKDIRNPSKYMLAGRPEDAPGSVVTSVIEGSRPIVTEVQSLVTKTNFPMPRRMSTGSDFNRINLIIAVLEKKLNINLGTFDIYINIAGGMKVVEPSIDCAIAASILSSFRNKPLNMKCCVIGEIGLTGEIRAVVNCEKRILEAYKMGFSIPIIPRDNINTVNEICKLKNIKIDAVGVSNVSQLLDAIFC